jgi:hypothetical protein
MELNAFGGKLITIPVKIKIAARNKRKTKGMIDSGANLSYISEKLAKRLPRETHIQLPTLRVRLPSGDILESHYGVRITYNIGTFSHSWDFHVLNMTEYSLVFGLDWLRAVNPHINWLEGKIQIQEQQKSRNFTHLIRIEGAATVLQETKPKTGPNIIPGRFNAIHRAARKQGAQSWFWMLRKIEEPGEESPQEAQKELSDKELDKLCPGKDSRLRRIVKKFGKIFRETLPCKMPPKRKFDHSIPTGDAKPINTQAYRLSGPQLAEQQEQIKMLLDKGLIRPSESEWGCPVIFVPKPGNKWRMCMDYRPLNGVTRKNTYPLPRIDECLEAFGLAKYFTKLDLTSGYWQTRVDEQDISKTAFNTRQGKFEFLVMPFGLTNAPATFQTMMNKIMEPFLWTFVVVYLDDIVIFSLTMEEHYKHVTQVLEVLEKEELYAHPEKCIFGAEKIEFCGHEVTQGTTRPLRDKVRLILDWPTPKTVHQVRQFLGLASYYRKYVKDFAKGAVPITELLKESDKETRENKFRAIKWTHQCQVAFKILKQKLCSRPILRNPDANADTRVQTDASDYAIGYTIEQLFQEK